MVGIGDENNGRGDNLMKKLNASMAKGIIIGGVGGVLLTGTTVFAGSTLVQAIEGQASMTFNGQQLGVTPKLVFGGTTYVQLYTIQQALKKSGFGANWDGSTNPGTFSITSPNGATASNPITFSNVIVKGDGIGDTVVNGIATNNSSQTQSCLVVVSFFDANGHLLGTATGAVNSLAGGQQQTWEAIATSDYTAAASYKVEVQDLVQG